MSGELNLSIANANPTVIFVDCERPHVLRRRRGRLPGCRRRLHLV